MALDAGNRQFARLEVGDCSRDGVLIVAMSLRGAIPWAVGESPGPVELDTVPQPASCNQIGALSPKNRVKPCPMSICALLKECEHGAKHTRIVPVARTSVGGRNRDPKGDGFRALLLDRYGPRKEELGALGARNLALFSRFVASAELIKMEWPRSQVRPLVHTTLVANNLSGSQSRPAPRRRLSCVAVVASPSEVPSSLGSSVIRVLDGNFMRNGISSHEGELSVLWWVHVRLGG